MTHTRPVKIELVDDDIIALRILRLALEDKSFEVTTRPSGSECLANLDGDNLPDVILLDVKMPPPDGIATLEQIRSRWSMYELPVILLTGMEESELAVRGFKGGANDFINKPINIDELITRVMITLREHA
jgi:DNA-binding response OmpR family regulator